jgi:hypothetical protein
MRAMFYPYYFLYNTLYPFRDEKAYIRILHASPDAPGVDVYANNNLVARNLTYKSFTEYTEIVPGQYNIKVFPAGSTSNPVIDTNITVPPNSIFTVAAVGTLSAISLQPISEPILAIPPGKLYVRFAHLSPDAPNVDITLADGTILFRNVGFRGVADYIPVNQGTYTIYVKLTGTDKTVLYVPNIRLTAGRFYTIYAVGLASGSPPLQVLIPLDGNSYIKF